MIFAPPRTGKSELATRCFPAWCLGKDPDEKILQWSYNDDSGKDFNRDVQRKIMGEKYAELFPATRLNSRNVVVMVEEKTRRNARIFDVVGRDGFYQGAGTGGPFTGKGGTLLLCDDPIKNHEEAFSKTRREKVWNFYRSTFYTRGEGAFAKGGDVRIVITLTRWHEDDLAGRLLHEAKHTPGADQWEVISLPAVLDCDPMAEDEREFGDPLWPEKYDSNHLEKLRVNVGSRDWHALYQQRPSPPEGGMFKRAWWRRYTELPTGYREFFWSWDMAFKDTETSSFVVGQLWCKIGPNFYLVKQVRGRMDFVATLAACDAAFTAHPEAIRKLVEDKANGPAVISALQDRFPGFVAVTPKGGKEARAVAVSPLVEGGNVFLPEDEPWVDDFIEEHAAFPKGKHDDQVDAMSQALSHGGKSIIDALEGMVKM